MDYNEFSNHEITIYNDSGEVIKRYTGEMHIFSDTDKNDAVRCIHFMTPNGHHCRIYTKNLVIVEEY